MNWGNVLSFRAEVSDLVPSTQARDRTQSRVSS